MSKSSRRLLLGVVPAPYLRARSRAACSESVCRRRRGLDRGTASCHDGGVKHGVPESLAEVADVADGRGQRRSQRLIPTSDLSWRKRLGSGGGSTRPSLPQRWCSMSRATVTHGSLHHRRTRNTASRYAGVTTPHPLGHAPAQENDRTLAGFAVVEQTQGVFVMAGLRRDEADRELQV